MGRTVWLREVTDITDTPCDSFFSKWWWIIDLETVLLGLKAKLRTSILCECLNSLHLTSWLITQTWSIKTIVIKVSVKSNCRNRKNLKRGKGKGLLAYELGGFCLSFEVKDPRSIFSERSPEAFKTDLKRGSYPPKRLSRKSKKGSRTGKELRTIRYELRPCQCGRSRDIEALAKRLFRAKFKKVNAFFGEMQLLTAHSSWIRSPAER
jgi:hypothetical protein